MALTKVRPPVTEVSQIAFGTTQIDIPNSGGDIDVDVAGANVVDIAETTITLDDLVTLVANQVTSELINLATTSGATGKIETDATKMQVGTTGLFPLELIANLIPVLTLKTDGKVTLATQGTDPTDLIDKAYVDAQTSDPASTSNAITNGSLTIDATPNDIVLNWGISASISNGVFAQTFDTTFPNAAFGVLLSNSRAGGTGDQNMGYGSLTTSGFDIHKQSSVNHPVFWLAVGY